MGKKSREKRERREKGEIKPQKREIGLSSFCLKVIKYGTYLALFSPLIVSPRFFFPFVGPKSIYFMGFCQIILAFWIILIVFRPKYRPRFNSLLLALLIFVIFLILSSLFGTDFSRSFWSKYERMTGLLMHFHLLAFFLVISSTFKEKKDWLKIFGVSVFVAIIMSILSLLPEAGVKKLLFTARGGATIGNTSFMATYLLFNLFLAIWLFFNTKGGFKIYSLASSILIALGLFWSTGYAAIISFFLGIFLLFLLWLITQKGRGKLIGIFLLALLIIGGLVSIYLIFQPESSIHQALTQKFTRSRFVVWEIGFKGWKERPLLGWGPENFEFVFAKHFNPCLFLSECGGEVWFDRAHNILFDGLVSSGILGFFSYLSIFVLALYILWKKYLKEKILNFWTVSIFTSLLFAYFLQNLTVFDMINSYLMFFLVLGFIGAIASFPADFEEKAKQRPISFNQGIATLILIFLIFSFFKFTIQPLRADRYVIKSLQAQNSKERLSYYQKALGASPLGKYQIRIFLADQLKRLSRQDAIKRIPKEDLQAEVNFLISELEKSIKEAPLDFHSHLKLGELYNAYVMFDGEKLSRAEEVLKRAIELSPKNQQSLWALAQTKVYQENFPEALSLVQTAVSLEPRVLKSWQILIQVLEIMGQDELAREKAKEALKINPHWQPHFKEILEEKS